MKRDTLQKILRFLIRVLTDTRFEGVEHIPTQGGVILATNHLSRLDIPVLFVNPVRNDLTGLVADKYKRHSIIAWFTRQAQGIWLDRTKADFSAFRDAIAALGEQRVLGIAPEGTRSRHGCLQEGHPGIVLLAVRSGAPILPVVYYGHAEYKEQLLHFRRPRVQIVVGQPFYLDAGGKALSRDVRDQMTAEIMYQMAALLPPHFRGHYADMKQATQAYLRFGPQAALQF